MQGAKIDAKDLPWGTPNLTSRQPLDSQALFQPQIPNKAGPQSYPKLFDLFVEAETMGLQGSPDLISFSFTYNVISTQRGNIHK